MRKDMVFVKGGKYKLYENNNIEVETFDLEVSKYLVTQKLWTDVMGRNPSLVEDILGMKPVENITWWHTLQFCNKLSELEGLKPVYDLSQIKSAKLYINQLDDEKSINYYEDFLIDKNANPEMYFQTFLSEGILEIIYQKSTEYNEFNRDIYVDEMTIPDLEIIANKISKELGKEPKYSKEEIEKDILKAEEVNKEKEEEKEY